MALTNEDLDALQRLGLAHDIVAEGGMTCVKIPDYRLPDGFTETQSTLLLRLNPGFPDVPPDMWWFDPPVHRQDGAVIECTEHYEHHLSRRWQRWSRHLDASQWQSGIDALESFLAIIRRELKNSSPRVAKCA